MLMAARRHNLEGGQHLAAHRGSFGRHAGVSENAVLERHGLERHESDNSVASIGMEDAFMGEWEMVKSWPEQDQQ
eukprot:scaffold6740_cov42-Prasinocladus_malaysianus.AAC.1